MRPDADAYAGGEYSQAILANAPHAEDGYVKVNQIQS
jgi:Asp-tRNA(Asn)/Glu-tRNA(Gln) amidotransferase C subunit